MIFRKGLLAVSFHLLVFLTFLEAFLEGSRQSPSIPQDEGILGRGWISAQWLEHPPTHTSVMSKNCDELQDDICFFTATS